MEKKTIVFFFFFFTEERAIIFRGQIVVLHIGLPCKSARASGHGCSTTSSCSNLDPEYASLVLIPIHDLLNRFLRTAIYCDTVARRICRHTHTHTTKCGCVRYYIRCSLVSPASSI